MAQAQRAQECVEEIYPLSPSQQGMLMVVLLAGMSIPLSVGGWGPREAAGVLAAVLVGAPAATGLAVAAGYGLLATASVLPGFVALVIPMGGSGRRR